MSPAPGDLAGRVVWQADGPQRGLHDLRPDLASVLTRGRPVSALPALLSALYALCGQAHQLASRLAIDAARAQAREATPHERLTLRLETLREHLRRIALDWPRAVPLRHDTMPPPASLLPLTRCPALQGPLGRAVAQAEHVWPATATWVHEHLLNMAPAAWLAAWQADGEAFVADWCDRHATWPARWLRQVRADALAMSSPLRPWWPDDVPPHDILAGHETGPWCRLHDRASIDQAGAASTSVWWRLCSRLAELARLCLPEASPHATLHQGSLTLGTGQGLAWVEMARGTLLHWVHLDGTGDAARVQSCRVVPPTAWNFHADGPVARLLHTLPDDDALPARAALAAAAWDPCVPFTIAHTPPRTEPAHA